MSRELEIFMVEYLENHLEDVQEEYNSFQIEEVIPDIENLLKNHPLKHKIIENIKNADYSESNSIYHETIYQMSKKLGIR